MWVSRTIDGHSFYIEQYNEGVAGIVNEGLDLFRILLCFDRNVQIVDPSTALAANVILGNALKQSFYRDYRSLPVPVDRA